MRGARGIALAFWTLVAASAHAELSPSHVVLVVWDGMRPDFVTETNTPTLWKLAHQGVWFRNHHSIYPTATDVNGAALATGCYPNRNGLLANSVYRSDIDVRRPIDSGDPETIKHGDEVSAGRYLEAPTFVEQLRAAGKRVALAGTKSVAILFDRRNEWTVVPAENRPVTIFAGAPISALLRAELREAVGPFRAERSATSVERNMFTTMALTEELWRDGVPDFSLLWLSEPDLAEHDHAPGSPEALQGLRRSDENLGRVLSALEKKHVAATTDVLVASDHGFSTIRRSFDVIGLLKAAGFRAEKEFPKGLQRGDVMVAGNGGTCLFYVGDHDAEVTTKLVDWLQSSAFAGVIFTRVKAMGTFDLATIKLDHRFAPDVVVAFRWDEYKNRFGTPGVIDADWNRAAGQGTHATLSRFDVQNLFIAAGPHFAGGTEDELPTANIDIAPTTLQILGLTPTHPMDGRIVAEAMPGEKSVKAEPEMKRFEAVSPKWLQTLETSSFGGTTYFNAGNNIPVIPSESRGISSKN